MVESHPFPTLLSLYTEKYCKAVGSVNLPSNQFWYTVSCLTGEQMSVFTPEWFVARSFFTIVCVISSIHYVGKGVLKHPLPSQCTRGKLFLCVCVILLFSCTFTITKFQSFFQGTYNFHPYRKFDIFFTILQDTIIWQKCTELNCANSHESSCYPENVANVAN